MPIRFAKKEDIFHILEIYRPYVESTTVSFEYVCPSLEEFTERFTKYTQQFPWLVWEEEGEILGYAYACAPFTRMAYSWVAEASVYLCPKAHRKGIGSALYAALEELLRKQGYLTLYALAKGENRGGVLQISKLIDTYVSAIVLVHTKRLLPFDVLEI